MSRQKTEELTKHTMNLRTGDLEKLQQLFPKIPASVSARRIISRFVDKQMQVLEQPVSTTIDL